MASSHFPAEEYSSKKAEWLGSTAIVLPTVTKALQGLISGKTILDIGCGPGDFAKKFIRWGAEKVFCIDNSEEMVEVCKKNCEQEIEEEKILCCCSDIQGIASGQSFDVAAAFFVFQFIENVEELRKALLNTYKHLKDGGILVALVPNGVKNYNPKAEEGKKFGAAVVLPEEELRDGLPMTVNFYSDNEVTASSTVYFYFTETYERLLRGAGFRKVEWMDPTIDEMALKTLGEKTFRSYMNPPKDVLFKAYK